MNNHDFQITNKAMAIPPFIAMDVMEKAQQLEKEGRDIIHLEVGEPDFETPSAIKNAAIKAIQNGDTHYTNSLGKLEFREEIAYYYQRKYQVKVSPEQIIVTSGSSPAMYLIFAAVLEPGDEVILSDPHYACYPKIIQFLGGKPVFVPINEEEGFKYNLNTIKKHITPKTKLIMVNSPANPTGIVFSKEDLQAIANLGYYILSDEIYHGLVYKGEEHSMLEFTDHTFVLDGFSKRYAMTGWRLGYLIAPEKYIRPLQKIQQNFFICANSFIQIAGITALRECDEEIKKMAEIYNHRRIYLLKRLQEIGIATKAEPTGAFYALANIKKYTDNSFQMAFDILEKAKVAVTPGIDFGKNAEGYLRISYATSLENIKEGMNRLERYFHLLRQ
ncbi:MAG: pyridoxal phosphate-dependent aminotransferase [Atribacterota bacterium]|nr:pyridoxal phosphate-dependent aminotransferase [Atribacterota bacterium]